MVEKYQNKLLSQRHIEAHAALEQMSQHSEIL
jgi:hypothetical protein